MLIQVGDFGVGFNKPNNESNKLKELNKFLKERNITMLVIRGNHDNPTYFKGYHIYSNLMLLPDYTTMKINGLTHLFVGGALSIDRQYRQSERIDRSYWDDEVFVYDEKLLNEAFPPSIDVLVTHTTSLTLIDEMKAQCYLNEHLVDTFVSRGDDELRKDLREENILVEQLINKLPNLKFSLFGHYHTSFIHTEKNTKYKLLDIFEFYEPIIE